MQWWHIGAAASVVKRQRRALEIHDNIVQRLAAARLSFETNPHDPGMGAASGAP